MQAKKSLGQNFLHNKKILEETVRIGEVSSDDTILEVGPGHGELTEFLAKIAKKVIAVEKDGDLVAWNLKHKAFLKNVELIEGDILKMDFSSFKLYDSSFKVIANIPYYITSHFLKNTLTAKNKPSLVVLMVQYEVAKRISASAPDMNLLALSAQAYGKVEFIKRVSRGNFNPSPKVDSAIIKISEISDKFFEQNKINEEKFFEILRKAFQQKRKMLRATLGNKILEDFKTRRPETLTLEDWKKIYKSFTPNQDSRKLKK